MRLHLRPVSAAIVLVGLIPAGLSAQIGQLHLGGGLAQGIESDGLNTQPIAITSFSFVAGRFSLGPEGFYIFGDKHIYGLGGVARYRVSSQGHQPYLILGLGGNFWRESPFVEANLFSASVGGGVSFGSDRRFVLEARFHDNLQNYGGRANWAFLSLTGGARVRW